MWLNHKRTWSDSVNYIICVASTINTAVSLNMRGRKWASFQGRTSPAGTTIASAGWARPWSWFTSANRKFTRVRGGPRSWSDRNIKRVSCSIGQSALRDINLLGFEYLITFTCSSELRDLITFPGVMVIWQFVLSFMISHEVWVVWLFLVIHNHSLDICQHVLTLPVIAIFHLALLDALHSQSFFVLAIVRAAAIILLIATSSSSTEILLHERLHLLVTYGLSGVCDGWPSFLWVVSLIFLFLTAVVASVMLAWVGCEVALLSIPSLQIVYSLLQFSKVNFKIFVDFSHLKILFLEILPALISLT